MVSIISIICLSIVAVLCAAAALSPHYPDNLLQRLGLCSVGLWCAVRVDAKLGGMPTDPVHLMLHIGLALFALGTALRVLRDLRAPHNRRRTDWAAATRLHEVAGGRAAPSSTHDRR